ncbi:MAG: DUF3999 family protein [Planctomycetes bacterium]|nr:DUF3999 family protein [Planctomycetota bacterium]
MKRVIPIAVISSLFSAALPAWMVDLPSGWKRAQSFPVSAPGLVKIDLPIATLDAARPDLEDLRLYDEGGKEVPYLLRPSLPAEKKVRDVKRFQAQLAPTGTLLLIETGTRSPIEGVTLITPAESFLKAVRLEISEDQSRWQSLAQGLPIFRQAGGPSQLYLKLPPGIRPHLRITVDDQMSPPVPFSGAQVHESIEETPTEPLAVEAGEKTEIAGQTRIALNLKAAHLRIASLELEAADAIFTRQVDVAARQIQENEIRETSIAGGAIYRWSDAGRSAAANLIVPVEAQAPSRELLLLIHNQDSPPLAITGFKARRRPVFLIFHAAQAGKFHLLSGNSLCPAPRYDLASLGSQLKDLEVLAVPFSGLADNPAYRIPEAVPDALEAGAPLEVSPWKFRKPVICSAGGLQIQQLELDLEVLSRAKPGLEDLRLARGGQQLPYLLERTAISRSLAPPVAPANDPGKPRHSRWAIKLPRPALPVERLGFTAKTPMFKREMMLYEEVAGRRGEKSQRFLSRSSWEQAPERPAKKLVLRLSSPLSGDTLYLETDNGDNPALELEAVEGFYLASRIYFKNSAGGDLFLYYGNPQALAPRYDLSLAAGRILAAEKKPAALGQEEILKKSWLEGAEASGKTTWIFWGVLGLVVVILLLVIRKLVS